MIAWFLLALAHAGTAAAGPHAVHTRTANLPFEGGKLAVRASWPAPGKATGEQYPVILFSHGRNGNRDGYRPLAHFWASHGYVVLQPSHDADKASDPAHRPAELRTTLEKLDALIAGEPELKGRVDPERVGVAGHSFGAFTALQVGGMVVTDPKGAIVRAAEPRTDALLILSPPGDRAAFNLTEMAGPALFVTGTNDDVKHTNMHAADRLKTWDALGAGPQRWLLWIDDTEHTFGGIGATRWAPGDRVHDHVAIVQKTTLAFWDSTLKESASDATWMRDNQVHKESRKAAKLTPKPATAPEGRPPMNRR